MTTGSPPPPLTVRGRSSGEIVNIAAYHFVTLENLSERRADLRIVCRNLGLRGTILLTPEGINLFLAGNREAIEALLAHLRADEALRDLEVKESLSDYQPFERLLVKIKQEIIAFGQEGIDPRRYTSRRISAKELQNWLDQGRDFVLLDTRNNYEVRVGTFVGAVPVDVDHFRDFPEAIDRLPEEFREKPIVTFCTGGIRCEKAAPFLEQAGFREVYQLDGGILKYFEDVGGDHYNGECFVFDKRVALGSDLRETKTTQCYACLSPLTVEDQQSPLYDPPHTCPHCHLDEQEQLELRLRNRRRKLDRITSPLPGSIPYNNVRPLNVAQRFDGFTLLDYLRNAHPHLGEGYWERECNEGRIHQKYRPVRGNKPVRAGEQFAHLHPGTTEPDVNAKVEFLYEDDQIVVVNKPAPLPVHPSGRFHRNSLQWILNEVYRPQVLKPAHRLDANTTGLIVFSKTRSVARVLQPQFEEGRVTKTYLALVHGNVEWKQTICEAAISREPANCGGRTIDEEGGLPSRSRFECLHHNPDGTSLILAVPETGRTNQLRVHLWHLGTPIVGDPLYLPDRRIGTAQTLSVGETMCLHAWKIGFHHPSTNDFTEFETVRPDWARD